MKKGFSTAFVIIFSLTCSVCCTSNWSSSIMLELFLGYINLLMCLDIAFFSQIFLLCSFSCSFWAHFFKLFFTFYEGVCLYKDLMGIFVTCLFQIQLIKAIFMALWIICSHIYSSRHFGCCCCFLSLWCSFLGQLCLMLIFLALLNHIITTTCRAVCSVFH